MLCVEADTWVSCFRHGVPGGADGGAGEGADGAWRRPRGDHDLLVSARCASPNC